MRSEKVGFLNKENETIYLDYSEVNSYCQELCNSDQNIQEFGKFRKKYTYFTPYFDFVMFKLNYVFINPLLEENTYLFNKDEQLYSYIDNDYNTDENRIPTYNSIVFSSVPNLAKMVPCSDKELTLAPVTLLNIKDSIVDPNGMMMMSYTERNKTHVGDHEKTSATVLNQILISSNETLKHFKEEQVHTSSPANYLVRCLGFLRTAFYNKKLFIAKVDSLLTPRLSSFVEDADLLGMIEKFEEEKDDKDLSRERELITLYSNRGKDKSSRAK